MTLITHFPTISQLLESALKQDPSRIAINLGDKSYSYKDLDTAANIIASHFRRADLAGERVAFMLPNGFEILTSYLACFKSGAISMPLNRRYAQPELHRVLANALPKWLIIESDRLALLNNLDLKETGIEKIFVVGQQSNTNFTDFNTLLEGPEHFTPPDFAPQQPAVIFYTSGSTGEPKGVVHTHRSVKGILESTASALDGVTREDIVLVRDPQCHISGFIESLTVLVNGGIAVLHDGFDLDAYLTSLEEKKPTLIVTHIDIFLKLLDSGRCTRDTFSSSEQELKDFALKQIAAYKTPARIYFIERMPLTPSGKIDHKKLYDYLPN